MIGTNEEIIQAYTEIGCLLRSFPVSYIEKLPNKFLDLVYSKVDRKYIIDVDVTKTINEQNISKKTKEILSVLTYKYWSDEEQKELLSAKINKNEQDLQNKLAEQYSVDKLFKTNEQINEEEIKENVELIEYKENIFTKIINAIKNFFKR